MLRNSCYFESARFCSTTLARGQINNAKPGILETEREDVGPAQKLVIKSDFKLPAMPIKKLPNLTNFKAPKESFSKMVMEGNQEYRKIWHASDDLIDSFREIFPEVVQTRNITKLQDNDFQFWDKETEVKIELDDDSIKASKRFDMVAVGGPCTLSAAYLYKLRYPNKTILHAVSSRNSSNHDGSAYYYHERDCVPVYVHLENRGFYCVYIDLKKRIISKKNLIKSCTDNLKHVQISLNWSNLKLSHVFNIFIPNTYHMFKNIYWKNPKKSDLHNLLEHAKKTHDILDSISKIEDVAKEAFLITGKDKALHASFHGNSVEYFNWLNKFSDIPFEEVKDKRLFSKEAKNILAFPKDGLISPNIVENLNKLFKSKGGKVENSLQLEKIYIKRENEEAKVTKIQFKNLNSNETVVYAVDSMIFSLGPTGVLSVKTPEYSLKQHYQDIKNGSSASPVYWPTYKSLFRHLVNKVKTPLFRGDKIFKEFMWAAGATSVLMVRIDLGKAPKDFDDPFTRFYDMLNHHLTLIATRDVECDGKKYRYHCVQMTGGGNFPSRYAKPDYLLFQLHSLERLFKLKEYDFIDYDIVQSRGCGRAVSSQNGILFAPIANNAVGSYALGGIGMTTLFPNSELLVQTLEALKKNGPGSINSGNIGNMDKQLEIYGKNIFAGIDYSAIIDDKNKLARVMGFNQTLDMKEKVFITSFLTAIPIISFLASISL